MKNKINKSIKVLMVKKLADVLSENEQQKLDKYFKKNELALQYFLELEKLWGFMDDFFSKIYHPTDLKKEWDKFIRSIENEHNRQ